MNALALPAVLLLSFGIIMGGCRGNDQKEKQLEEQISRKDTTDQLVKLKGKLFSIPSPYQMAKFIKGSGVEFQQGMVNSLDKATRYNTEYKQAVNMGIYGADLGYLNMYEQKSEIMGYFSAIQNLASQLGMDKIFSESVMKRMESNLTERDSLMKIATNTFLNSNTYLNENDRGYIGMLIIVGGWVESTYILCQLAKETGDERMLERVYEQKINVDMMLNMMIEYFEDSEEIQKLYADFGNMMVEAYGKVEFEYIYKPPVHQPDMKLTKIQSISKPKTEDKELLELISTHISDIRNKMTE